MYLFPHTTTLQNSRVSWSTIDTPARAQANLEDKDSYGQWRTI
jgi:hypothetical protein